MDEHIQDYKLLAYYKTIIDKSPHRVLLHSQRHCCESTIKLPLWGDTGVYILANKKQAKLFGVQTCKNSWACPVCSARNMASHANNISCALDALEKHHNKVAFMITFSIPHTARYTCKQTYEILQKTWLRFYHLGNKRHRKDPFSNFCADTGCEHRIRVTEFTWGKNGWHPHFHCLFWVDKDKLQTVKNYQKSLHDKWLKIAHTMTKRVLMKDFKPRKYPPWDSVEHLERWINNFFGQAMRKSELEQFSAAHISLRNDGSVLKAVSSQYICGWGADKELTGNIRKEASHKGHFTPHQILVKAYELHKQKKFDQEQKWVDLYLEFAATTFRKMRVRYSPNLNKIIANWKLTQTYITAYKKKAMENREEIGEWKIVCWFKKEQWLEISYLDKEHNIIHHVLNLAPKLHAKKLITEYLLQFNIDITTNGPSKFGKDILKLFAA